MNTETKPDMLESNDPSELAQAVADARVELERLSELETEALSDEDFERATRRTAEQADLLKRLEHRHRQSRSAHLYAMKQERRQEWERAGKELPGLFSELATTDVEIGELAISLMKKVASRQILAGQVERQHGRYLQDISRFAGEKKQVKPVNTSLSAIPVGNSTLREVLRSWVGSRDGRRFGHGITGALHQVGIEDKE